MRTIRTATTASWQWRYCAALLRRSGAGTLWRTNAPTEECRPGTGYAAAQQAAVGRRRGFWLTVVGSVDALLRAYHGIGEYTDDPACVFRIGLGSAQQPVNLADGTEIAAAELVGSLHLWNERLPPYANGGPDFAWAADMRRRVHRSLQLLADVVERDPAWKEVWAFRGDATLSRRLGEVQIRRLAARHGFERVESPPSILRRLHFLGDCFNAWALTLAFNPAALKRQAFLRCRCEVWISRRTLMERYGRAGRLRRNRSADQAG